MKQRRTNFIHGGHIVDRTEGHYEGGYEIDVVVRAEN
jgi:hypothetical protein